MRRSARPGTKGRGSSGRTCTSVFGRTLLGCLVATLHSAVTETPSNMRVSTFKHSQSLNAVLRVLQCGSAHQDRATRVRSGFRHVLYNLRGGRSSQDSPNDASVEWRLKELLVQAPDDVGALFRYAHFLTYNRFDYLRAEQLYLRVLDLDENHVGALIHLGYLKYLAFNDYSDAAAMLRRALEVMQRPPLTRVS